MDLPAGFIDVLSQLSSTGDVTEDMFHGMTKVIRVEQIVN